MDPDYVCLSPFLFVTVEISNVDAESAAANFQHLNIQNEDTVATKSAEDNPAVILPDHLQATNADCAHLALVVLNLVPSLACFRQMSPKAVWRRRCLFQMNPHQLIK